MAENETHETIIIDDELKMGVQKLSLQDSDDQPDSNDLSEPNSSAPSAIGADEAKDSETLPPEAENQPVKGRVFVGGISWRTTDVNLREYFGQFGVIKDSLVCKDKWTGKSRGFGFLSFEDPEVAETVISKTHNIGGRTVQVKTAVPKSNTLSQREAPRIHAGQNRTKIFVGGLHRNVNNKEFRAYFEPFGKLTDAFIMYNMQSKRSRGFGFVTFVSPEATHKCLREHHTIRGKAVELKLAIPREVIGAPRNKRKFRHGHRQQQPHPQHHQYDGWSADVHSTAGAVSYGHGHLVPTAHPMITPPDSQMGAMIPQPPTAAAGVNPAPGVYDQWMPPVMGVGRPRTGMGAGMYSQDVYYGSAPPLHGMAANPYGYGYHVPMYGQYPEAPAAAYDPAAAMYDPNSGGFARQRASMSAGVPPPNGAAPPLHTAPPPPNEENPSANTGIPAQPDIPPTHMQQIDSV